MKNWKFIKNLWLSSLGWNHCCKSSPNQSRIVSMLVGLTKANSDYRLHEGD